MTTKLFKSMNLIRCVSGANLNLFRYAAMVLVLLMLGAGNAWGFGHDTHTATLNVNKGTGSGTVYASTSGSATSGSASASFNCGGNESGQHTGTLYAYATPASGYTFLGWTTSASSSAGADNANPKGVAFDVTNGSSTQNLYAHFVEKAKVNITFEAPSNGTYTIAVNGGSAETVSSANVVKSNVTGVTLTATPASGYAFAGWYKLNSAGEFVEDLSIASPYNASFTTSETIKMGARFVPTTLGKFILKGSETQYYGLKAATIAAGGSGTIVPVADETVVDGSDLMPFDNGTYTIKAGATLLVPYSSANEVQTKPKDIAYNTTGLTTALSIYKKLITREGVSINVMSGGVLCVGGQLVSYNGGNPSAYPIGACGVLDMSNGGHIELNGAIYCWGFIKGQDMDQGNNTVGVGSITANSGSVIWEDFAVGDWRGGSACSTIAGNASSWKFFPFQSYTIQNVEVPTTYHYGATLSNYTNVYGGGGKNEGTFSLIGKSNTLFQLKDASSSVCKWYDPTTDLVNYEMRGTAQLDALNVDAGITTVSSSSYNLPLSSNMQIVLAAGCNMTLSKPMVVQPGAVVEVKSGASLTLSSNTYIFDVDNWGMYCNGRYFYSMTILTSHKNRGTGKSKDLLDDAKLIVDGTLNVTGKIYATDGGANIMGNGAGSISLSSLGGNGNIVMCTGVSTNENVAIAQANLCNEDESYTKSIASTTFHNVNGRWFAASAKDEKANHTYDFTYISSGAVSGTGGTSSTTDALYAPDKTGLIAGMKWCNVEQDATCSNIYNATQALNETPASEIRYTYPSSSWLQLLKTETEGVYGGSDNSLYAVDGCAVNSLGSVDENCLYTIGGVKKALVDGHFVALEKNTEDEAWHDVANPTNYYICFEGCNWHPATKYAGQEKAYIVEDGNYIWYNNDWLLVEREDPFFFDYNDQNVKRYYEYEDGAWVLASPRVRVVDAIETREFYKLPEAISVASGKKNTTITILKDISGINSRMTYSASNTTCTLDLNGHTVRGAAPFGDDNNRGLLIINASGTIFTITDNSANKEGRLENICNQNKVTYTVHLMAGTLNVEHGTIHAENPAQYHSSNLASCGARGIHVAATNTLNVSGGRVEAKATRAAYAIVEASSAANNTTVNITGGEIYAEAPYAAYGVLAYGKLNVSGANTITAKINTDMVDAAYAADHANNKKNAEGRGIYMHVSANKAKGSCYYGTLTYTGGTINVTNERSNNADLRNYGIYFYCDNATTDNRGGATDGSSGQKAAAKGSVKNANITVTSGTQYSVGIYVMGSYNSYDKSTHVVKIENCNIDVKGYANNFGIWANAGVNSTNGGCYHGDVQADNCTVHVESTGSSNAYGAWASATATTIAHYKNPTTEAAGTEASKYYGEYASAAKLTINGGSYTAKTKSAGAYAVGTTAPRAISPYGSKYSDAAFRTEGGHAKDSATLIINGGTFKATAGSYTARGVSSGGNSTINDATFTVVAGSYYAYGLYASSGKLTATNVLVNDTAKGRVSSSDNNAYAYGAIADCAIPTGNTAQNGFGYAGEIELNNCTLNVVATAYQNARGIMVNASSKLHNWTTFQADSLSNKWTTANYNYYKQVFPCTIQGKDSIWMGVAARATANGGKITVKTKTTTAYGAFVNRALKYSYTKPNVVLEEYQAQLDLNGTEFDVQTEGTTTAEGVRSYGQTTITDGSFFVKPASTTAYGLKVYSGKTIVNGNPTFTVKATKTAYGIHVGGEAPHTKLGYGYDGEIEVNGGTFNVETTSDKPAYGLYVYAGSTPITSTASGYYAGNYASAGKATINAGEFNVTSKKTEAYGIYMSPTVSQSGATDYPTATATPVCNVNDGVFTATGTTEIAYGAYVSNGATLTVTDGSFKGKLTAVAADKYAVGAYIAAGGILDATGGTFEAEAAKSGLTKAQMSYACGLYSPDGTATISASNATFKGELKSTYLSNGGATTWSGGAYGFYARTTTPLSLTNCTIIGNSAYQGGFGLRFANTPAEVRNCNITVTTTKAYNYGLFVGGADCDVKLYDCNFTCTSGTTYAYGIYAYNGATYAEDCEINAIVQRTGASSVGNSNLYGVLVATGKTATLKGCTITAIGSGKYSNNGYGVYVDGTANLDNCDVAVSNINDGAYALFNTSNTTLLNVASGKYKASATTNAASTNGTAAAAKQVITGGYYSTNSNLSKYTTAPYQVLTLPNTHTEYANGYRYKVAEAYTVTFMNGSVQLQSDYVETGVKPVYAGTPTKAADAQYSYTFDGWTTNAEGTGTVYTASTLPIVATAAATYFAHYSKTENKYTVTVSTAAHGSVSPAAVSNIGCETASGDITATPATGYSFSGWTLPEGVTAATGYNASSNPIHIHATTTGKSITANFVPRTDINYTVKHWQQNLDNNEYTEYESEGKTGTTATPTAAAAKSYTGFTAQSFEQGTIAGNGSTIVNIYYNRNTYTITWVDGNGTTIKTDANVKYGATPEYAGETPTKTQDNSYSYTFTGWEPAITTVTADATYTAQFEQTARPYTITWLNCNGVLLCNTTSYWNEKPAYPTYETPTYTDAENRKYQFTGWSPEIHEVNSDVNVYTAQYERIDDLVITAEEPIEENTTLTTTTVRVEGKLNVAADKTLTTDDLILEATPSSSGEITGEGTVTATRAYFDFSNGSEGFKAKTWYAVAVPWQVNVPAYDKAHNGVYITNDGEHYTQQELGRSFDLIYYDGALRASEGHSDACWKYIEDDASDKHIMYPGRAYMIYLTSDAQTIRFERKSGTDLITNTLAVYAFTLGTGNDKDANWNGIANPATYHAYINANVKNYSSGDLNVGQVYNAETRTYSVVNMSKNNLVVGQPIFVQATAANPSVVAYRSLNDAFHAPRRAKAQGASMTRYELMFAPNEGEVTDRIIVRMDDEKETDEYIVGQDLVKMGVSDIVPQMWVDRYDGKMCINTVAPVNNRADYPLGISVQQSGAYDLFIDDQPDDETMLYLTYDGEAIWNLSYGGYVANLEKGSNTHYGLRIVRSPKVTTGIEETTIQNGDVVRKVVIEDKVFIIRNGQIFGIDGRLAK